MMWGQTWHWQPGMDNWKIGQETLQRGRLRLTSLEQNHDSMWLCGSIWWLCISSSCRRHERTLHMIGRDNQSEEHWLNNKVKAYLIKAKSHPNGWDALFEWFVPEENWLNNKVKSYLSQTKSRLKWRRDFLLSALFKGDTTDSSYQQYMEMLSRSHSFFGIYIYFVFFFKLEKE